MSDIFVSYSRSNESQAQAIAVALRALGYDVWRDDQLPAHKPFAEVIDERLRAARAVIVLWSADAAKSQWVRAEADVAREAGTLVQVSLDGSVPPLPFNQIQCAVMVGRRGESQLAGWRKAVASIVDLVGTTPETAAPITASPIESIPLLLPGKPSIAVMPFSNLSGDPDQEYFADGMVIEIVEALSRFRNIFVIASASSRSFKGREVSAQVAARQLGVRYVLEGSVRKAGGRVRIGVQLIDAVDGASIMTERFEDSLEDVFELQDTVARAVAGRLEPTINAVEFRRVAGRSTEDMDSYDLYLRGHSVSVSHSKDATLTALDLLNRSIALDPQFGPALARAAHCYRLVYDFGWSDDPQASKRQCIELAQRALEAAPDDATVVATIAYIRLIVEGDDKGAIGLIDRAIKLNPGAARVLYWSGRLRLVSGDPDRAIKDIEASLRLDPVGPIRDVQIFGIGLARFAQGQFDEALVQFRESGLLPTSSFAAAFGAACFGQLGQVDESRAALARFHARSKLTIEAVARTWLHHPEHLRLFMEGIAMAAAEEPLATSS